MDNVYDLFKCRLLECNFHRVFVPPVRHLLCRGCLLQSIQLFHKEYHKVEVSSYDIEEKILYCKNEKDTVLIVYKWLIKHEKRLVKEENNNRRMRIREIEKKHNE